MFKIKNLSYSYKLSNQSNISVLDNLNFELPNKGLIFITGKSGCGKTTLLNILEGILKPTSGNIYFNEIDIYKNKKFDFAEYFGILFQNYNLIDNLTVFENLKIAADIKNLKYEVIDDLLKRYNLLDFKNNKIDILSGGEKQRVAFIRAIINCPQVLFCDEPTGAIDEENAKILMSDLRKLSENSLVIVVTHNKDLIRETDLVIELNHGKIFSKSEFKIEKSHKNKLFLKKTKHKSSYINLLTNRLFTKSSFKHVLFIISMFFSILFIELTFGLSYGLKKQEDQLEFSYFNFNKFSISEREKKIEIDSPISLIKEIRPNKETIKSSFNNINNIFIFNNYDYLLSGNNLIFSGSQELKNIKISLSLNTLDEVVVNDLFFDLLENKNSKLSVELNQIYNYKYFKDNEIVKTFDEKFYYSEFFKINKVVKEFKYLNEPTIYLPLVKFEECLKRTHLKTTFNEIKEIVTWYDVVTNAKPDDLITSFSYNFYIDNKNEILKTYKLIDNLKETDSLKINNDSHFYVKSFLSITKILTLGLNVFCILSIIVTFSLLFFIITSLFLEEKKEIAILKILGVKNKEINKIFNNTIVIEILFSFFFALLISIFLTNIFNQFIEENLAIYNLILLPNIKTNRIQIIVLILTFLISILFAIFINFLAIFKSSKTKAALELREE